MDLDNFEQELEKLAKCSIQGFEDNFLYTKISIEDFIKKYQNIKKYINPDFVFIVEDSTKNVHAFMFTIKDFFDSKNETIIIKSMVRIEQTAFKGVASYLVGKVVQKAKESGFRKIIHAMMIKDNLSVKTSKNYSGKEYKSYSLYGVKL